VVDVETDRIINRPIARVAGYRADPMSLRNRGEPAGFSKIVEAD